MALKECPDCGKAVSTMAPSCPDCGRPFFEANISQDYGQKFSGLRSILGVALSLAIGATLIYVYGWAADFQLGIIENLDPLRQAELRREAFTNVVTDRAFSGEGFYISLDLIVVQAGGSQWFMGFGDNPGVDMPILQNLLTAIVILNIVIWTTPWLFSFPTFLLVIMAFGLAVLVRQITL
jgi:hypothetical protein